MAKLSGLQEIRNIFSAVGWDITGVGNHAAEFWFHEDYVGLVARGENGKWRCTHNMIHNHKDDEQYIYATAAHAAQAWIGIGTFHKESTKLGVEELVSQLDTQAE